MSTEQPEHRRPSEPSWSNDGAQPAEPACTSDTAQSSATDSRDDVRPATRRVVISSLTGKPITWDSPEQPRGATAKDAHEAELLRDVPPHWGRGS